jgi:hypothetical protein
MTLPSKGRLNTYVVILDSFTNRTFTNDEEVGYSLIPFIFISQVSIQELLKPKYTKILRDRLKELDDFRELDL